MKRTFRRVLVTGLATAVGWLAVGTGARAVGGRSGEQVVSAICIACHRVGVMGAPKFGDPVDWAPRVEKGRDTLVQHALQGFGQMPARGGDTTLSDDEVARAVDHMIAEARPSAEVSAAVPSQPQPARQAAAGSAVVAAGSSSGGKTAPVQRAAGANRFNRLMKPPSAWNPPPVEDGIHDPTNPGTTLLQPPRDAFGSLPKTSSGNRVDWVQALKEGQISPRFDRVDVEKQPAVLDFNVVREVKGTMPDVVYPHEQHTRWLDCSNCHPGIFIPRKGANEISMASILMGQKCGVCHGKVAFPVSECRRCHSKDKESAAGR